MNRMLTALSLISLFAAAPAFAKSTHHLAKAPVVGDKAPDGTEVKPAPEGDKKPVKKTTKKTTKKAEDKKEAAPEAAPAK